MNIIIPLGGKGERFFKNGYMQPKPLIQIFDKFMIEYILDNISISSEDKVFIIYNFNLNLDTNEHITDKYPFINLIKINDTKGAAETLYLGINYILNNYTYNNKCLILDCDTFYTENIIDYFRSSNDNIIFYTKNYDINPIYSYIELSNESNHSNIELSNDSNHSNITNIQEKNKISDNANTGAYAFTDINILYNYCKHVINNKILFNNEHLLFI